MSHISGLKIKQSMKRGIFLVANQKSEWLSENLIYSIRKSGCLLPIKIIHFGGEVIKSQYVLKEAEIIFFEDFPEEAKRFIIDLSRVINECPLPFLYRFYGLFAEWNEFIYSDNDIVALTNWEELFDRLGEADLLHADEEYLTKGVFNYNQPERIEEIFGSGALESAITAGHIVMRKDPRMLRDFYSALEWFVENPGIAKRHDQTLLHITALLGNWKLKNLCKGSDRWLSSWAGDYKHSLDLIQKAQQGMRISHIHYSGSSLPGDKPLEELLYSFIDERRRLSMLGRIWLRKRTGLTQAGRYVRRIRSKMGRLMKKLQ